MSSDGARVLGDTDATIVDIPGKGQPPGDPPDGAPSWASMVTGTSAGGRPNPESLLTDEFVVERLSVEFPNGAEGEAVVTIGQEVLEVMNGLWKQCMIVKVLGRTVPIAVLSKKLKEMWRPKGVMKVLDLPRGFFMVRFGEEEEYLAALTGGPWKAFGSYLLVRAWSSDFDPLKDEIVTAPVWVRLSHLPVNFYHRAILMGIAKGLGKPLRVDPTTLNVERARFARICVEVNLRQPLKGSVMINGERYYVSYAGLTNICSRCGIYGHALHTCPRRAPPYAVETEAASVTMGVVSRGEAEDGFVMTRKPRQAAEMSQRPVIEEDTAEIEAGGGNGTNGGDKENSVSLGGERNGKEIAPSKEGKWGKDLRGSNHNFQKGVGERNVSPSNGGAGKSGGLNGQRRKSKNNQPTRGVTFGPVETNMDMQSRGKRSRTEREVPERSESRFTPTNAEDGAEGMVVLVESGSQIQRSLEVDAAANSLLCPPVVEESQGDGGMDLARD
ncbi:unnamed protein product [Microthlaspi erraticum]|uniref:DUF4283 domain-containing protein n=1 Tax=Microthlaspi erraticum TaxID=1685480 RepID=A0A6D2KNR5_9BRAS|nr:unnamed protein product [Microthlaspi erraticum]